MPATRIGRRVLAVVGGVALSAALIAAPAAAANAADPATVSQTALPTAQLNGVAFSQVVVGNVVYVGGSFSTARPAGAAAGSSTSKRANLLAYDLQTGKLLAWNPGTNGLVRSLARSSDGKTIYMTGAFTQVGGKTRTRIAAVSAATGSVVSSFHPTLNGSGWSVAVNGNTVWAGGAFTSASGKTRPRAASFDRTTGAVRGWSPTLNDTVLALVVEPSAKSVVLAGRFSKVNGKTHLGSQRVDASTGRTGLGWKIDNHVENNGPDAAIYSLSSDGSTIVGTGYSYHPTTKQKRLEGAFLAKWSGDRVWLESCHGDSYSAASYKGVVYLAGHPHDCTTVPGGSGIKETDPPTYYRALAFTQSVQGTLKAWTHGTYTSFGGEPAPKLLGWRPSFNTGSATGQYQGPWSVTAGNGYVLYAGEFTKVNGKTQQGLVRFKF